VAGEADAIFRPQWGVTVTTELRTLVSDTDAGGLGLRRSKWQAARYRIRFTSAHASSAEAAALEAWFATKKGSRTSWTWTCPSDGVLYTCRFAADQLPRTRSAPGLWEYDIDLVAVAT
jgi:hypothetical protein